MDVSKTMQTQALAEAGTAAPELNGTEFGGEELIQQVVTLSGLPEDLAHEELDQILKLSGKPSAGLTLDDLRTAMLSYLETLASADPDALCEDEPLPTE
jgi:hypothetical protein